MARLLSVSLLLALLALPAAARIDIITEADNSTYWAEVFLGAANMDNDPGDELVYCLPGSGNSMHIIIVDGATGDLEWSLSTNNSEYFGFWIAGYNETDFDGGGNDGLAGPFCDANGDGLMEITFAASTGAVNPLVPDRILVVGLTEGGTPAAPAAPSLELGQNYPNPFNPSTRIDYSLGEDAPVRLDIFDVQGRLQRTLVDQRQAAGDHSLVWDGRDDRGRALASGNYFYQLRVGDSRQARRALLLK